MAGTAALPPPAPVPVGPGTIDPAGTAGRGASPAPALSMAEEARLRRQISCLRRLDAQDRSRALGEWDKGSFLRRVRDEALWRRSAEHPARSFLDFVQQVSSLRSRGAVERRLLLVERYSREEFQEYVAAGTGATALCEIARAEEELRPHLLQLARKGLTVAEVGYLRGVARRQLRRPAMDGARGLGPELARHLHEEQGRREEKRRLPRGKEAADRGAEAQEARAGIEELGAERHALEAGWTEVAAARRALREREEELEAERRALRAQAVPPGPAQPREREATLAAREARLGEREAALAAREAQPGEREAALAAREARLGEREAEMQREAEEAAAARFAERETRLGEREAALAAREAQLGAREAQLAEREVQLDAREAQLVEAETGLHKIAEEQAAERADLDFHQGKVANEAEAIAALRAQLGRERVQLLDWAVSNQRVHWPAPPRGMDEALLWLRNRLLEAQAIGELGRHLLDKKRELPQY